MSWTGEERRAGCDSELWELLRSIDKKIDIHLEEEKQMRPKLEELLNLLVISKGVITITKALFYIGAPFAAIIYWIKDHVKL